MRGRVATPLIDRFHSMFTQAPSGCWLWTGALIYSGYGRIGVDVDGVYKGRPAHRVAYELLVGPIPDGLTIDHLCRVRHCVNPAHLEAVTIRENILRGETRAAENAAKRVCIHGHPFAHSNTYVTRDGKRQCKACRRVIQERYRARRVAA